MTKATSRAGYSGSGYITGFDADSDQATVNFNATAGLYEMRLRYATSVVKGYDAVLNGLTMSRQFDAANSWATASAGKVLLKQGSNSLTIKKGWGYYDLDYVEFAPATIPTLIAPPKTLVDGNASTEARTMFGKLVDHYGSKTLTGQHQRSDIGHIQSVTGQTPAILGGDLIDYSPTRVANGANPGNYTEDMIRGAGEGYVVTLTWHWNSPTKLKNTSDEPWYSGFYTEATNFDVAAALADKNGADYKALLSDIDTIAVQLKKLSDAKVPVLWRPLHEAEGGWFWWGAKGSGPFKELWRLMFDRLKNYHGLHNLIWVYAGNTNSNFDWYPGDDVVDIVGLDGYPTSYQDPEAGDWDHLFARYNGKKMIALTEFGKVPDLPTMQSMGVRWSYFMSWGGSYGPTQVPDDYLRSVYTAPVAANLHGLN